MNLEVCFYAQSPTLKVAGLNPHAGEEGILGNEEKDWLSDALILWNEKNKDIKLMGLFHQIVAGTLPPRLGGTKRLSNMMAFLLCIMIKV